MEYKQTPEKRTEILRDYFTNNFATCFPHLEPILDPNGKVLCKPSYIVMFDLIRNAEFLRKDIINEILLNLDANELLVRKPQVIERIVEVERKPTAEEITKAKKDKFQKEHSQGFHGGSKNNRTELQRDDDHKPPVLTEQERVALNSRNARINEIILDTLSTINNYSANVHSKTYSRRDDLRATFNQHKNKVNDVESAEKLQRTIDEKINSYDTSSSGGIR
jgi:hypothetical protein